MWDGYVPNDHWCDDNIKRYNLQQKNSDRIKKLKIFKNE